MDKLTTLKMVGCNTKFTLPGKTAVFTKTTRVDALSATYIVKNAKGVSFGMSPDTEIVPETDATCADILGSWGRL